MVIALVVAALSQKRAHSAALAIVAVHLHFLCDLFGSRSSSPEDIWPIYYLAPFSLHPQWSNHRQALDLSLGADAAIEAFDQIDRFRNAVERRAGNFEAGS